MIVLILKEMDCNSPEPGIDDPILTDSCTLILVQLQNLVLRAG